jgi:hypothetical protein
MITIEFLRQFRFGGYAIFDLTLAFLGMYLISSLLSKIFLKFRIYIPKINWIFLTLPIGIIVHLIVGTKTLMVQNFFDINNYYILKIVILISLILGLRGIKIIKK